jgi:large subunit ribosomal protein L21e
MVNRVGSFRCKTRHTLRKTPRTSGKVAITCLLQQFNVGDAVTLIPEPAIHNGMPHPRYKNRTGKVVEKRGSSYVVKVRDGNSTKLLIAAPVHLKRVLK